MVAGQFLSVGKRKPRERTIWNDNIDVAELLDCLIDKPFNVWNLRGISLNGQCSVSADGCHKLLSTIAVRVVVDDHGSTFSGKMLSSCAADAFGCTSDKGNFALKRHCGKVMRDMDNTVDCSNRGGVKVYLNGSEICCESYILNFISTCDVKLAYQNRIIQIGK